MTEQPDRNVCTHKGDRKIERFIITKCYCSDCHKHMWSEEE